MAEMEPNAAGLNGQTVHRGEIRRASEKPDGGACEGAASER
ncbi:hypothetical protein DA2_2134 [Desulfovibrio sp. A2]|nr:hypothetical protein DA2_2134 [Desulfovibrio sp. A2]